MKNSLVRKKMQQKTRANRVRFKLKKYSTRVRLSVHKTNRNIYAQLVDDTAHKTIVGVSTQSKEINEKKSKDSAKKVGALLAKKAKEKQIQEVVFDRGKYKYHGIVAHLADAARAEGLKF